MWWEWGWMGGGGWWRADAPGGGRPDLASCCGCEAPLAVTAADPRCAAESWLGGGRAPGRERWGWTDESPPVFTGGPPCQVPGMRYLLPSRSGRGGSRWLTGGDKGEGLAGSHRRAAAMRTQGERRGAVASVAGRPNIQHAAEMGVRAVRPHAVKQIDWPAATRRANGKSGGRSLQGRMR